MLAFIPPPSTALFLSPQKCPLAGEGLRDEAFEANMSTVTHVQTQTSVFWIISYHKKYDNNRNASCLAEPAQ